MNSSVTLVDAMVVIYGHRDGWFSQLADSRPLAVTGQVVREAAYFMQADGTKITIDLAPLLANGVLKREEVTVEELSAFVAKCPSSGLGAGEKENLAIVHNRALSFCTTDVYAMKVMKRLGLHARWCSLASALASVGLDPLLLPPEWGDGAWPH